MRGCRDRFPIALQSFGLIAQFFIGLAQHALDEHIVRISLLQFLPRPVVVSGVERDVTYQLGKECRLLGNSALVENSLGCSHVLLRRRLIAMAGRNAGLCMLPAEVPQVLAGWRNI